MSNSILSMKSLFTVVALFGLTGGNKTLEEAYGHVEAPKHILPWGQRAEGSSSRALIHDEKYHHVRLPENCVFPLEVIIVQDATASFQDDYAIMRDVQLKLMTDALRASHPDSKFGVVSFRDKPVWSLGDASDYCERFELTLSSDLKNLQEVYGRLVSTGGADPAENQFGAILATAQSATPGWTANQSLATRLVVLSTDAYPHFADDGLNSYGMSTFSGTFDEANAESQCLKQYYPSPAQVKQALETRQAYLAQLVFDGDWQNGLVRRSWEWMNSYLGQTSVFLEPLANDSSNFWDALASVIKAIEAIECVPVSTTPPTSTEASTTTTQATTTVSTTPPETTTITELPTTTPATTTPIPTTTAEATVTDAGSTQLTSPEPECPPCSPPCEVEPCPPHACPCNDSEVLIKVAHRPKSLNLVINNEEVPV